MKRFLCLLPLLLASPALAQRLPEGDDTQCMANTIWGEAGSEDIDGMIAVGFVIRNRLDAGDYGKTLCAVVHQRKGGTCQFKFWCGPQPALTRKELVFLAAARYVAEEVMASAYSDPTHGALWFHKGPMPSWLAPFIKTGEMVASGQIGAHTFVRLSTDKVRITYRY